MKRVLICLLFFLSLVFSPNTIFAAEMPQADFQAGDEKLIQMEKAAAAEKSQEILVKFKPSVNESRKNSLYSKFSLEEKGKVGDDTYQFKDREGLKEELLKSGEVEYIEPNTPYKAFLTPNDTFYNSYQWNLKKILMPQAWDIRTDSSSVTVAVLDSGIEIGHPDLQGMYTSGYNFVSDNTNVSDIYGHGTFVSGIIGAIGNNNAGIAGLSWNARIMPVKVMFYDGTVYPSDAAEGIYYAVDHGAKVINMSFGGSGSSQTIQNAVDYALTRGVLLVAAVGNDYNSTVNYPAACSGVVGVGATDSDDNRCSFSNYNSYVDLTAPGYDIPSTVENSYYLGEGTSASAPHVAGLAALVWSGNPTLSASGITDILQNTAVDLGSSGRDNYFGYGRINAYAALSSAVTPITINSLTPDQTSPQASGTTIRWTCNASGGTNKVYLFKVYKGSSVETTTPWSANNYYDWTPAAAGADYRFKAYVKESTADTSTALTTMSGY
ncbi:MAG: S8 family serine peptidase, partial [Firmicutes bacterium]|nr:S8 family serine peptidase [Bacillota bacterium]